MTTKVIATMTTGIVEDTDKASSTPVELSTGSFEKVVQLNAAGAIPDVYLNKHVSQWRYIYVWAIGSESIVDTGDGWEEVDTTTQTRTGGAMTVADGVFTFPETGIWLVAFHGLINSAGSGTQGNITSELMVTSGSGGSVDNLVAQCATCVSLFLTAQTISMESIVDVTATADVKVKLRIGASVSGANLMGHTSFNKVYFTFTKLGDT